MSWSQSPGDTRGDCASEDATNRVEAAISFIYVSTHYGLGTKCWGYTENKTLPFTLMVFLISWKKTDDKRVISYSDECYEENNIQMGYSVMGVCNFR